MMQAVEAARQGDLSYFQSLPDLAAILKQKDEDERSLLHTACGSSSLALVQFLLDQPGSRDLINAADEEGWTPLHTATSVGDEATARLLISLGADVNAATQQQRTALFYACSKGLAPLVTLLLQSGAQTGCRDVLGDTPLHRAASTGRLDVLRVLLAAANKPSLEAKNKQGATPLLLAAMGGHQAAALYLAAQGADVEAEDNDGETPLGAAAAHGKLRDGLVRIAKGEATLDDFMIE